MLMKFRRHCHFGKDSKWFCFGISHLNQAVVEFAAEPAEAKWRVGTPGHGLKKVVIIKYYLPRRATDIQQVERIEQRPIRLANNVKRPGYRLVPERDARLALS